MSSPSDPEPDDEWEESDDLADLAPALVVVIDTSLIIEIKVRIGVNAGQWALLHHMLLLVAAGRLAFPSKVHREVTDLRFPDAPGAWCGEAVKVVQYPDPEDATMVEILAETSELVEENADAEHEVADPYVVAMAYELKETGRYDVAVATTDCVDRRPYKIAMTTACRRLGITSWDFDTFVAWVKASAESEAP